MSYALSCTHAQANVPQHVVWPQGGAVGGATEEMMLLMQGESCSAWY